MDKGIRAFARNYFAAENAKRIAGEVYTGPKANTAFRKAVMVELMTQFGITLASAATHYNEALITVRKTTPEAVAGLGRPEDKKGGRKPKETAATAETVEAGATMADVAGSMVLGLGLLKLGYLPTEEAAPQEAIAA